MRLWGTYLLVHLDEGGLELLLDVLSHVVGESRLREGFTLRGLLGTEVSRGRVGKLVKWSSRVLCVSDLFKFHVGNLLE